MPFSLIGLGLGDVKDITVRGLEVAKAADTVYLEAYTSVLINSTVDELSEFFGRAVTVADREMVESGEVLDDAKAGKHVALLVVGDPFGATTHSDLVVRCHDDGIKFDTINNASILNAVGITGLQLYRFGQVLSLCYWTDSWQPDSWYPRLEANIKQGVHTLLLVDIKVKEVSFENLARGKQIYEPPRFMTVNEAVEQVLAVEKKRGAGQITEDTIGVGVARVGSSSQQIVSGPLKDLLKTDFGKPLHSLIICGDLHEIEAEHVAIYAPDQKTKDLIIAEKSKPVRDVAMIAPKTAETGEDE